MTRAVDEVLAAGTDAMLSAFDTTALRLGTACQNIEKDFWVCWTLDALFHGLKEGGPRPAARPERIRRALAAERNHQGKDNVLLFPPRSKRPPHRASAMP